EDAEGAPRRAENRVVKGGGAFRPYGVLRARRNTGRFLRLPQEPERRRPPALRLAFLTTMEVPIHVDEERAIYAIRVDCAGLQSAGNPVGRFRARQRVGRRMRRALAVMRRAPV